MTRRQARAFAPLSEARLRALSTARLLAYQERVRRLHERSWGDLDQEDERERQRALGLVRYKSEPAYVGLTNLIRQILSEREHQPTRRAAILAAKASS